MSWHLLWIHGKTVGVPGIFGEQSGQQHGGNLGDPNKRFANHIFKQLSAIFKKSCKLNIEKGIFIVSELEAGGFSTGVCSMS